MYTLSNIARHHFSGPEDVYVLDLHRTAAGLAAIASDGRLALLDPARFSASEPTGCWAAAAPGTALTALRVFDEAQALVCTAGGDGGVGVWDLRLGGEAARVARFKGESARGGTGRMVLTTDSE